MTEYVEVSLDGVVLTQRRIMQAWCCEVLGMDKNDMSDLPVIYFATEADASMFCLRWLCNRSRCIDVLFEVGMKAKFGFVDDLDNNLLAIVDDRTWYANNYDDICAWLEMHGKDTGHMKYSTGLIFLPSKHVKDLFILRWS